MYFFYQKKLYYLKKVEIDANLHLTKDYIHPIYKLSSIKNSSKEEEQSFPLSQK